MTVNLVRTDWTSIVILSRLANVLTFSVGAKNFRFTQKIERENDNEQQQKQEASCSKVESI